MVELYQKIKEEFESVEAVIESLCLKEYTSPSAFLSDVERIQSRYIALTELADVEFLKWLAEKDATLYMNLVRWASTVSAIGGCIANLYPEEKEHAAIH